jgi:hypothetical protein
MLRLDLGFLSGRPPRTPQFQGRFPDFLRTHKSQHRRLERRDLIIRQ